MVAQLVVGIGMDEYVKRAVIEREPSHDLCKALGRKSNLVTPTRMRPDRVLVEATHLDSPAEFRDNGFTELPCGIATGGVEIDMRMPARDTRSLEIRHGMGSGEPGVCRESRV